MKKIKAGSKVNVMSDGLYHGGYTVVRSTKAYHVVTGQDGKEIRILKKYVKDDAGAAAHNSKVAQSMVNKAA